MSRCRFAFVAAERANHAVAKLCRIIGASVSDFYAWLRAIPAVRSRAEAEASCAAISAASSPLVGGSTAPLVSTPSCAGRAGGTRAGASHG